MTRTPNYDGMIGPRIRSSSMRSSRFTIGQVMVAIAVFASLLAVPRLAVSPDRIVMVCLVGLLTVLVLLNMLVEMVFGKLCPSCSRWTLRSWPGTVATTVARRAGDDSSGSDWAPGLMRPAPKTRRGIGSEPRPAPGKDSRPPKISERQPAAGCFRASEPGTCPAS